MESIYEEYRTLADYDTKGYLTKQGKAYKKQLKQTIKAVIEYDEQ